MRQAMLRSQNTQTSTNMATRRTSVGEGVEQVQKEGAARTKTSASPSNKYTNQLNEVKLSGIPHLIVVVGVIISHGWFLYFLQEEYENIEDKTNAPVKDYIEMWIPIFLGSIFVESAWMRYKRSSVYQLADSLCDMSTGMILQLVKKVVTHAVGFFPYLYIWQHFALTRYFADGGAIGWWLMFVGVEFGYYWVHRTGHTVGAFWAMHGVHHSSEDYNLSVSLRQSGIHTLFQWVYYLPLALFFPPSLYLIHNQYNTLYQYWIHTQAVTKLGPLEYVLNTPSQHRVHHGKNPYCIDKNYGGTLCIFDRMFGTFQEEIDEIPIVYGNVHPINTFNPVEANILPWRGIWTTMQTVGFFDKFLVLFNGPGRIPGSHPPQEYPIPPCTTDTTRKYDPKISYGVGTYMIVHWFITLAIETFGIPAMKHSSLAVYTYAVYVLWSLCNIGGIADRRWWIVASELLRLAFSVPLALFSLHPEILAKPEKAGEIMQDYKVLAVLGLVLLSVVWVFLQRAHISKPLAKEEMGETDYDKAEIQQQEQYRLAKYKAD